ncbi:MAG TPA: cupin domain-containing protein [Bryobacteraceae bacterium]|nr:cupin domain-containing protein [Bryobacteraceae bacterium]
MFIKNLSGLARFSSEKMGKADLARGEKLFAGLNCFEPGQEHAAHTHAGQDKLYVILTGEAEVRVGDESAMLIQGDAAFAPSGVVHSIRNAGETRLVVMAVLAPPPGK